MQTICILSDNIVEVAQHEEEQWLLPPPIPQPLMIKTLPQNVHLKLVASKNFRIATKQELVSMQIDKNLSSQEILMAMKQDDGMNKTPLVGRQAVGEPVTGVRLSCKKCPNVYKNVNHLKRHVQYECGKEPMMQCKYCNARFKRPDSLRRHMHHSCQKKIDQVDDSNGFSPNVSGNESYIMTS